MDRGEGRAKEQHVSCEMSESMPQAWQTAVGTASAPTLTFVTSVEPQGRTEASDPFISCTTVFTGLASNAETDHTTRA